MIETGRAAPKFKLPDQDGNVISLADLKGKTVVLYFYPKADTPGCTVQACGVRDRQEEYERAGAVVLGVSKDPVKDIRAFADKYGLAGENFHLLSDEDHAVAEKYGAWGEKSMYGRKYMGMLRSTFIIDPKGKVAHVIPKASPKTHDDVVLGMLEGVAA